MENRTDLKPQTHGSPQSQGQRSSKTNRNSDRTITEPRTTESLRWTGRTQATATLHRRSNTAVRLFTTPPSRRRLRT